MLRKAVCAVIEAAQAHCHPTTSLTSSNHRTQFKDVGKGWYSLTESRQDTYDFSKLKKFMVRFGFDWACGGI